MTELLTRFALVVKEVGALGISSAKDLKDILQQHFGIRNHELYIHRSLLQPFIVIFTERHARDVVFGAGRLIEGPIELLFHE
jgi:hypothetical protein